jgi:hypothetical protein
VAYKQAPYSAHFSHATPRIADELDFIKKRKKQSAGDIDQLHGVGAADLRK